MDETNLPEEQGPVTPDFSNSPELKSPLETEAENTPKKSKLWLFIVAVVVLLATAAGAYYYFVYSADEAPPSLTAQSNLQGFIGTKEFGFGGWEAADIVAYDAMTKVGTPTDIKQGVNYFHADEDMSLKEIIEGINPDSEAFALGMYGAEEEKFYLFPKTTYYNQSAIIPVTEDATELAEDNTARDPEDVVVPAGTGFVFVSQKASEGYGFNDGTVAGSMDSTDLCEMKEGWNLVAAPDKDLKSFVDPCLDAIKYIYVQDGAESFEKVYKRGSTDFGEDNIGQLSDHYLVWIKFDETPVYKVPTPDVLTCDEGFELVDGKCYETGGVGTAAVEAGEACDEETIFCDTGLVCEVGICVVEEVTPAGVCGNGTLDEGEACDGSENCTENCGCETEYKAINGICHKIAGAGEVCDGEPIICDEGLVCDEGICKEEIAGAGEACDGELIICEDGLVCTDGICEEEEEETVAPVCGDGVFEPEKGEECETGAGSNCSADCTCREPAEPNVEGNCILPEAEAYPAPTEFSATWKDMGNGEFALVWNTPEEQEGYTYELVIKYNENDEKPYSFSNPLMSGFSFNIPTEYLIDGRTYTFYLKAIYTDGVSEVVSDTLTYTAPVTTDTSTDSDVYIPTNFTATASSLRDGGMKFTLKWDIPDETDGFEIYEITGFNGEKYEIDQDDVTEYEITYTAGEIPERFEDSVFLLGVEYTGRTSEPIEAKLIFEDSIIPEGIESMSQM